jgi:N-terminal domain of anti-restriction factor ArdC
MARSTSRLSESEREQRRARDRERLKVAAEQLLGSEGWERWVRVRSRNGLARYSVNNQLLIALVRPDATFVAGFRAWLELGYQVDKGEKAIRMSICWSRLSGSLARSGSPSRSRRSTGRQAAGVTSGGSGSSSTPISPRTRGWGP